VTYLLDTNVISVAFRDPHSKPANQIGLYPRSELAIPSLVRAELSFGALKGGSPTRKGLLERFLAEFPTIPFDDSCVPAYAMARHYLEVTGQRIGAVDLMIAAVAATHHLILVTHNTSEFSRVPGRELEDWQ